MTTAATGRAESARRIRRLSRALAAACLIFTVMLPVGVVIYWLNADTASLAVRGNLPASAISNPLSLWQRLAGAALTGVPLAFLLVGLWHARRCFRQFATGPVFTVAAVRHLRRFAGWAALSVLGAVIAETAATVVLTMGNPPGMRHIAVAIGSHQMVLLFFAALVWLMAAVIDEGHTLADENAGFI